jgi:hypothetical protein
VVVEFSANDSPAPWPARGRQAYEQLLRALLALPGQPAVVLLHHYPWHKAAGDGATEGLFYIEPELQLTTFAQVRQLWAHVDGSWVPPLLSADQAVWARQYRRMN